MALGARALAAGDRAAIELADPSDPVFRALYPDLNPDGIAPFAEPAVARGRTAPRSPGAECLAGFRIAEPRTRAWTSGSVNLLTAFLVTTDHEPGVTAPCYQPEPWVCVLVREPDGTPQPVDCLRIEGELFPWEVSLDTAPFDLDQAERAFGVRIQNRITYRWGSETDSELVLFRLHERRLSQILRVRMGHEVDDSGQGEACARELVLAVEKTRTSGFFDWSIRVGEDRGPGRCNVPEDPVGTYRWDGARYVKAPRGKR